MMSFLISSSDIFFVYAASGFSVECAWFFSLMRAKRSKLAPPYLWPYSMPTCANTPACRPPAVAHAAGRRLGADAPGDRGDRAVAAVRGPGVIVGLAASTGEQAGA